MSLFRKLTTLSIAASVALTANFAQAGEWSYYEDSDGAWSYHESYDDSGYSGSHVAGALAAGMIGGFALGAIATTPGPRTVIVHENPECYRAWKRSWSRYESRYVRQRILICD